MKRLSKQVSELIFTVMKQKLKKVKLDTNLRSISASNNFNTITVKKEPDVTYSDNMNVDDGTKDSSSDHKGNY